MEDLIISSTAKSPEIKFFTDGRLYMSGISIMESAQDFFVRPIKWIEQYVLNPAEKTIMNIDLDFFNTSSQIGIFEILMKLSELKELGNDVEFNWYYTEKDLKELGEDIASLIGEKFNFIKKD